MDVTTQWTYVDWLQSINSSYTRYHVRTMTASDGSGDAESVLHADDADNHTDDGPLPPDDSPLPPDPSTAGLHEAVGEPEKPLTKAAQRRKRRRPAPAEALDARYPGNTRHRPIIHHLLTVVPAHANLSYTDAPAHTGLNTL